MSQNKLKVAFEKKKPVFGLFVFIDKPSVIEIMGYMGFDFAIFDGEHAYPDLETVEGMVRAAEIANITSLMRVPEDDFTTLSRVLETGIQGVLVPHVKTAEQARRIVRTCRFAPLGDRSFANITRAGRYASTSPSEFLSKGNEKIVIGVQIEEMEGVDNLSEIISVEGIDFMFIGPYDLANSLGYPGNPGHPRVVSVMEKVIAEVSESGKIAPGLHVDAPPYRVGKWLRLGARFITCGEDITALKRGFNEFLGICREAEAKVR